MEGCPLSDAELMERARQGDVAAFEELVRRYEQIAFRTAFLVCGDADEARDAAQECFVRAWRALPSFRGGAEARPWMLRIVANAARNRRRRSSRQAALGLRLAEDPLSGGAAPSPEGSILAQERRETLLAAIGRLSADDRLVIGLRWFVDMDEASMAAVMNVARGTVKSRLSRAMARLRTEIDSDV
ncbi:MAG: sigma-70 family RNA polymerase sigma factor [Chloroflexota bacterium]